jgi:YVTN family beta-propeller protein
VVFTPDGKHAYINAENDGTVVLVDVAKGKAIQTIHLGKPGTIKPMGVLLSADGGTLFVSSGRGKQVFTVDTATNKVTGSVEVGTRPWGIALSPDGKMLFSANGPSNDVAVVDVATNKVVQKIACGQSPWGVITLSR